MPRQTTFTLRLTDELGDFVATKVGEDGPYLDAAEYIRDLIRRDKERAEEQAFERLKAELTLAFAAPEASYAPLTASDVIQRNRP